MQESRASDSRGAGFRVMLPPDDETRLVREFFGASRGYFVDVGANDPFVWSQTFHLEQLGWGGVLIEPQPDLAEALRRERMARVFAVGCSSPENSGRARTLRVAGEGGVYATLNPQFDIAGAKTIGTLEVPVRTLDQILVEAGAPVPIDFLSIDVEGHEIEVLRGFDIETWQPRLILIEDHVLDRRLHGALTARGYAWMRRTGLNSWYVPAPSAPRIGPYGRLQFVRKYYLGMPIRRLREALRRRRQRASACGVTAHA
jgi:FkbM family methyltransferase